MLTYRGMDPSQSGKYLSLDWIWIKKASITNIKNQPQEIQNKTKLQHLHAFFKKHIFYI